MKKAVKESGPPNWMWPLAVTVVSLAAIGVGGFLYLTKLEMGAPHGAAVASRSQLVADANAVRRLLPLRPDPGHVLARTAPPPLSAPAPAAAALAPPPLTAPVAAGARRD